MRNTYIEGLQHELPHPFRSSADRLAKQFDTDAKVTEGIVRWKSSGNIPPSDILEYWKHIGKEFNYELTKQTDEVETTEFFKRYAEREANRVYSEEELFEMRAAFGPGEKVVNVITGREIQL